MPTYEYKCRHCHERLEAVQSFSDADLKECPSCGEPALRKMFGNVGVVFKGSGFYRNDSRQDQRKESQGTDKPKADVKDSGSGTDSGSSKSDSASDSPTSSGKGTQSGGKSKPDGQGSKAADSGNTSKAGTGSKH